MIRAADAVRVVRSLVRRPSFVLVLGMHRSGTSLAVRVLEKMGAVLGPVHGGADLAPGEEAHGESPIVNWINEQVLRRSGGSWRDPPASIVFTARDRWRCRAWLGEVAAAEIVALKDPRILLTYDLWRSVLPPHRIVACLRHPASVARSLERRDGMDRTAGLELWRRYNEALRRIVAERPDAIWFDFDEGAGAVERLAREIAALVPLRASADARAAYEPASHRFRAEDPLPPVVGELHDDLRARIVRSRA
jgi:hypothetical protein